MQLRIQGSGTQEPHHDLLGFQRIKTLPELGSDDRDEDRRVYACSQTKNSIVMIASIHL